jgi:hypothetical protein
MSALLRRRSISALVLLVAAFAGPALAGVESHNQYRQQGPPRYVISVWEVVHDQGVVKTFKRTFKWKETVNFPGNTIGVLPGEWYGPVAVDKSVDHLSWAGSYWRQDGAFEENLYVVEVKEGKATGTIKGSTYPVEVTFRLMKRPPLMQPNVGGAQ